jgi:hypothetical protein
MKCKDAEKQIYLYRELSQQEQLEVDQHVRECASCKQLMQTTQRVEALLKKSADVNPQPKNSALLTQRILSSIKKKEQRSFTSSLFDYLNSYFTRYAFAALSVFLVTVFVSEYSQETVVLRQNVTVMNDGPILDTKEFHQKFYQRKQQKDEQPVSHYAYYKKLYSNKTI